MTREPSYGELKRRVEELEKQAVELEQAIRESRELYRLLAENVSDVIFVRDMDLRFTYISPSVEKLTGYSVEEAMALTMAESYTPQTIVRVMEAFSEELSREDEGQSDSFRARTLEMEGFRKDGSTVWTEAKMSFLRDSQGRPVGILGVSRDITERKHAERAMVAGEERYRSLVEDMPVLLFRLLPDGTLTFVNKSCCHYFARERETLVGENYFHFVPEEERRQMMERFGSLTREHPVVAYEHQVFGPDGTRRWQHRIDRALYDGAGDLMEYQCLGLDVSELKAANEALRESEKRYRQLFNCAPAGIYEVDFRERKFVAVNDVMCRYTGYSEGEFLSMDPEDILSGEGKILFGGRVKKMMTGEKVPEEVEYEIVTKSGGRLWVAVNTTPVYEHGKVKGATAVVHDVTERRKVARVLKESEGRLRRLSAELIKAQEKERKRISRELHDELGQSLAILKHRVRSIGKSFRAELRESEPRAEDAVKLIDEVIEKVRQIARDLNPSILDDLGLSPALRHLTETLMEECEIPVFLDIGDFDALVPKESAGNVYRICQEALTNIMKHAEASQTQIRMRREDDCLILSIEDDGKGFDLQEVRARDGATRGLGLAVMEERAYLMGAKLLLSSVPEGGGTKVVLTIPVRGRD